MNDQETVCNHTNKMLLSLSQFPDLSQVSDPESIDWTESSHKEGPGNTTARASEIIYFPRK